MAQWDWEQYSNMPNGTNYTWNTSDTYGAPSTSIPLSGINTSKLITNGFNNFAGKQPEEGFWSQLLSGMKQNITQNPVGFGTSVLGGAMNIWQALDSRQRFKQALALDREKYELNRQIALNNEQRNQEQWDMMKRQRASSSL